MVTVATLSPINSSAAVAARHLTDSAWGLQTVEYLYLSSYKRIDTHG